MISTTSIYFESLSYQVNSTTKYIDYEKLQEKALDFRPKLMICGGSAYPWDWDYAKFRVVANMAGTLLLYDMALISGLVAIEVILIHLVLLRSSEMYWETVIEKREYILWECNYNVLKFKRVTSTLKYRNPKLWEKNNF